MSTSERRLESLEADQLKDTVLNPWIGSNECMKKAPLDQGLISLSVSSYHIDARYLFISTPFEVYLSLHHIQQSMMHWCLGIITSRKHWEIMYLVPKQYFCTARPFRVHLHFEKAVKFRVSTCPRRKEQTRKFSKYVGDEIPFDTKVESPSATTSSIPPHSRDWGKSKTVLGHQNASRHRWHWQCFLYELNTTVP